MITNILCVSSLIAAIFFLLRTISQVLKIVKDTFACLIESQGFLKTMCEDNQNMMLMLKEVFDFDRIQWESRFQKPEIIKMAQEEKKAMRRTLSNEHKIKIGKANKERAEKKKSLQKMEAHK